MNIDPPKYCLEIVRRLQQAGFEAVLAGGCVRDSILGYSPKDWDIATSAHPEQVECLFDHTIGVGRQFGIVIVVMPDGSNFEIATFRGDGKYADGRRPDHVEFVSMREDVLRRDFTVNALLYDPIAGKLHDFVGGQSDIENKILRAVGDPVRRFQEDKLRMLRAVRFAANIGFSIEEWTFSALRAEAEQVKVISRERIFAELDKILLGGNSGQGCRLLLHSELLKWVLPELLDLIGVEQPLEFHPEGDVWNHTLKILDAFDQSLKSGEFVKFSEHETRALAWATLLHDIGKPATFFRGNDRIHFNGHDALGAKMAEDVMRRLRCSNALIDDVRYLVANHMRLTCYPQMREATKKRHFQEPLYGVLLELQRMDCLASFGDLSLYDCVRAEYEDFMSRPKPAPLPLDGRDLIDLGYCPGPQFKVILEALSEENLEHPFASKDEAIAWIKKNY